MNFLAYTKRKLPILAILVVHNVHAAKDAPIAVSCTQDTYALCAYTKCTMNADMTTASCPCYAVNGTSLARIDVIPDATIKTATLNMCTNNDGKDCNEDNIAPICKAIADETLWPGADAVSTFSRELELDNGVVLDNMGDRSSPNWECPVPANSSRLVPNCMLAPCRSLKQPVTDSYFAGEATMECTCPLIKATSNYTIFGGLESPCGGDGYSLVNVGGNILAEHASNSTAVELAWEAVAEEFGTNFTFTDESKNMFAPGDPAFGAPVPPGGPFPGPPGGPQLGPGESNCIPHPSLDGTLFCGFRTQNGVTDLNTNSNTNTHLSCVTDNSLGYQYCANIGIYLQPDPNGALPPPPGIVGPSPMGPGWWIDYSDSFGSGPSFDSGPSIDSGPSLSEDMFAPPPPAGVPGFTHPPNVGCPMIRPMAGDHCNGWLNGGTENRCHYEQTLCLCESLVYGWQCNGAALSSYVQDPLP